MSHFRLEPEINPTSESRNSVTGDNIILGHSMVLGGGGGGPTQTTILRRRLYKMESELTKLKQALNDERQARQHASAKARHALKKLSAAEAELETTRVAYHASFLFVILVFAFLLSASL